MSPTHLRITLLGGNPELGNSEYMDHQDCPLQLETYFANCPDNWYNAEDPIESEVLNVAFIPGGEAWRARYTSCQTISR